MRHRWEILGRIKETEHGEKWLGTKRSQVPRDTSKGSGLAVLGFGG